jgi:hypothetical protein
MMQKISYLALAAGISTLLLIAISQFVPWWQFTAMSPANAQINFSPVNLNIVISGSTIAIPLLFAVNMACALILLAGGLTLIIYAVKPTQHYSKRLLNYGYKIPLIVLVSFIIEVVSIPLIAQAVGGVNLPLNGAAAISIPQKFTSSSSTVSLSVSAAFNWPFYFAIVATALSVSAKIYHRKLAKSPILPPPPPPPPQ